MRPRIRTLLAATAIGAATLIAVPGIAQAAVRNFDNETLGQPPTGTRTYGTATVENVTVGGISTRAVRVHDESASYQSRVLFLQNGLPAKRFSFDLLPKSTSQSTILAVHGTGASENTGAWRFLISPISGSTSGSLSVYNGTGWQSMATIANLSNPNAWTHIVVDASATWAGVTVGGKQYRTTVKADPASDITSFEVASSGTGLTGTDSYVDNLDIVATGFLITTEPTGLQPRFPDIVKLPDGRLLAVYQSAAAHTGTAANGSQIKLTFSSDNGASWTTPVTAVNTTYDDRDPKISVLADGSVLLNWFSDHWTAASTYDNLGLYTAKMPAGGSAFGAASHVATASGKGFSHGPTVQVPGGDVILPYYNSGAKVIRSHDGGATWDTATDKTVLATTGTANYMEPNIAKLPSGHLVMVIRTANPSTGKEIATTISRSTDNGLTWSPVEQTTFTTSSHHLLVTASGAVLFTFGNPAVSVRPTWGALIDNPEGAWTTASDAPVPLYDTGAGDQANPSSVETSPGNFLTLGYNVGTRQLFAFSTSTATYH